MTDTAPRDIHTLMEQGAIEAPDRLLNQETKEQLAQAGTPFTVTDIQMGDDPENGPFWQIRIQLPDGPAQFRMSHHERRDVFIQSIAALLPEGPISGLRLQAYPGRGGNSFISIEPA